MDPERRTADDAIREALGVDPERHEEAVRKLVEKNSRYMRDVKVEEIRRGLNKLTCLNTGKTAYIRRNANGTYTKVIDGGKGSLLIKGEEDGNEQDSNTGSEE